jgi:iron complex transport system ATP-binding protein
MSTDGMAKPAIAAIDLCVGYRHRGRRQVPVLQGVTARLLPGQLTFLLGPNGAGKSTLLRTLIGSQKALSGTVMLGEDELDRLSTRERARRLSVVLTDPIDVGLMTVRGLVALGRSPHVGWFSILDEDDRSTVDWALDAAGATQLADRQVLELSDGERQRAMIARALAQRPSVLLLDEPTAFLDLTRRVELIALLRRLATETGLAVLMSTHDLDLALRTADQLWLVHADGQFETGVPEDIAISGAIERAYGGRDMIFDHDAGTFVLTAGASGSPISIEASGPALHWARRAVHRAGHIPVADNAETQLKLTLTHADGLAPRWLFSNRGPAAAGEGFANLVDTLKSDISTSQ